MAVVEKQNYEGKLKREIGELSYINKFGYLSKHLSIDHLANCLY